MNEFSEDQMEGRTELGKMLAELRNHHKAMAEAINAFLNYLSAPFEEKPEVYDTLLWEDRKGSKGPFQRTSKKTNQNSEIFQDLQAILKEHKGFCHIGAYKYWFDNNDPDVIDRRKK